MDHIKASLAAAAAKEAAKLQPRFGPADAKLQWLPVQTACHEAQLSHTDCGYLLEHVQQQVATKTQEFAKCTAKTARLTTVEPQSNPARPAALRVFPASAHDWISNIIARNHVWMPFTSAVLSEVLEMRLRRDGGFAAWHAAPQGGGDGLAGRGRPGALVQLGSGIGYFSVLAAALGHDAVAVERTAEMREMLSSSVQYNAQLQASATQDGRVAVVSSDPADSERFLRVQGWRGCACATGSGGCDAETCLLGQFGGQPPAEVVVVVADMTAIGREPRVLRLLSQLAATKASLEYVFVSFRAPMRIGVLRSTLLQLLEPALGSAGRQQGVFAGGCVYDITDVSSAALACSSRPGGCRFLNGNNSQLAERRVASMEELAVLTSQGWGLRAMVLARKDHCSRIHSGADMGCIGDYCVAPSL